VFADQGFERPFAGPAGAFGSFVYDPTGSAWTFAGPSGVSANGSGFTAGNPPTPQGSQVAFLQETGSFSQSVAGWAAGSYVITFDAAQRRNHQASHQDFKAHTIAFKGLDTAGGDNTAFIDDVSVHFA
jgi:hypothetical protein